MSIDKNDTKSETGKTENAPAVADTTEPTAGSVATASPSKPPTNEREVIVRVAIAEACKQSLDLLATPGYSARSILAAVGDELMWKACKL